MYIVYTEITTEYNSRVALDCRDGKIFKHAGVRRHGPNDFIYIYILELNKVEWTVSTS